MKTSECVKEIANKIDKLGFSSLSHWCQCHRCIHSDKKSKDYIERTVFCKEMKDDVNLFSFCLQFDNGEK